MLRIILQFLLPLLLPFLAYGVYALLVRRARWLEDGPWLGLAAAGVGLMAVSLVTWGLLIGSPPGENYIPARMEDGRLIPGKTVED